MSKANSMALSFAGYATEFRSKEEGGKAKNKRRIS